MTLEAALSQSVNRRDFLNFARKGRVSEGQPPRRSLPTATLYSPGGDGPDWWNRNVTRRNLLIGGAGLVGAGVAATILRPWEWLDSEHPYMLKPARQLGKEVNGWRLSNGMSMVDIFPQIKQAADLLEGLTDPRIFLPQLKVPVDFTSDAPDAAFSFAPEFDIDSSRKIRVKTNDGIEYTLPFVKANSYGGLHFPKEVLNSSIRLAIAAKEASQIIDNLDFCKVYVSLLREQGNSVLENPDNIPTTEEEFIISMAYSQAHIQAVQEPHKSSWLYDFIDLGSHIRVGGIAFANWYKEQLQKGANPKGVRIDTGRSISGFLGLEGYITERNGMFVWTSGQAPQIASQEFLYLFNKYTGRN